MDSCKTWEDKRVKRVAEGKGGSKWLVGENFPRIESKEVFNPRPGVLDAYETDCSAGFSWNCQPVFFPF